MTLFTSGRAGSTPVKLRTDLSLEDLAAAAREARYPDQPQRASTGWGSPADDDSMVGMLSLSRLTVGEPQLFAEEGLLPGRLRLRYWWDRMDRKYLRAAGAGADWSRLHSRQAVDVVIYDDPTSAGRSVLISTRDSRQLRAEVLPALRLLGGERATVEADGIAESLDHDLFMWLLWRDQHKQDLDDNLFLEGIKEINSKDRLLRGARFTEEATADRIEMAGLLVMGKSKFGPAKVNFGVADLKAHFALELHLDGGFTVFRGGTDYDELEIAEDLLGHHYVDDVWNVLLPRLRHAHNTDRLWTSSGRDDLRSAAKVALQTLVDNS